MKKKGIVILIIVLLVIAGGASAVFFYLKNKKSANEDMVYVCAVSDIIGSGYLGESRYMGIVESQEVKGVNKDSDKTVKELYVEVEDEVKAGDVLFEYDMQEMELKLRQLELELQSINNNITTMNQQITTLTNEKAQAAEEDKLSYTAQIQNLQAQVNQANYDASAKQLEIDRQKAAMENSSVTAPMDGIIKSINENATGGNSDYGYGSEGDSTENAYITIMAKGDYRVKATASELNVRSMSEGQSMIIRSRVDNASWSGSISKIDLEHPDSGNNEYYYGGGESATKYPFYITVNNTDGLMLGQHVYVEVDYGQGVTKSGIWLDSYYIVWDTDGTFVWAEDANGRIEKRMIEVGEYDADLMQYEVVSGLETTDYIAYPEERIKVGMKTTHNYEDVVIDEAATEENGGEEFDMDDMNMDDMSIDGADEFNVNEDNIDNFDYDNSPYDGFDQYQGNDSDYDNSPYDGFDNYNQNNSNGVSPIGGFDTYY